MIKFITWADLCQEMKKIPEYKYLWKLKKENKVRGNFNADLYYKFLKARLK